MSSGPEAAPRARAVTAAVLGCLLACVLVTVGTPSAVARPGRHLTIAQVSTLLDQLSRQNDIVDENYNVAVNAVDALRTAAHRAAADAVAATRTAAQARADLQLAAAQRYESGDIGVAGMLLSSPDPQGYLDGLSSMAYLTREYATLAAQSQVAAAQARAYARRSAIDLASAKEKQRAVLTQQADLQASAKHFTELLNSLTAEQRRRYEQARQVAAAQARADAAAAVRTAQALVQQQSTATSSSPVTVSVPVNPLVQQVVAFAQAQVGKPYVFGAAGPDVFDCSGLTMSAWARAGVQLPHSAAEQYGFGTHVGYDQLQPGDLIFLYRPIEHVELYVGNDLAISAADPALGIIYVHPSSDLADYVGATRLTG